MAKQLRIPGEALDNSFDSLALVNVMAAKGDMVRLLLAHGADPTVEDNDRMTVFDHLRLMDPPEDPVARERLREIRKLLGDPAA